MDQIPQSHRDIFEKPNFAHLVTLMPDGSPQVTPVWIDIDGNDVLFNTADGRQKARNLDRNKTVALSILDSGNPYRYVQVRGEVVEKTFDGADAHIDKLAKKYLGVDSYPNRTPSEKRVIYRIRPNRVQYWG
ncbi:MAG: PPOX class F420-dependent oxidoreductase [Hyphomicrobiales bacterium]